MDNTFDKMYYPEGELIGGIDEAGVTDIAGPVVAACVILPKYTDLHKEDLRIFEINDSKKIPEKYRSQHAEVVWENALAIGIGRSEPAEIDYLGKHAATSLAMLRAIAACRKPGTKKHVLPNFILVDGERPIKTNIRQKCIQQADSKSLCVAAASIVAKVYRDEIMISLHHKYPHYDWISNKGYPCENHFDGIDTHGVQVGIHRIKLYPFVPNPRFKENKKQWSTRRRAWRQVTSDKMSQTLEGVCEKEPPLTSSSQQSGMP